MSNRLKILKREVVSRLGIFGVAKLEIIVLGILGTREFVIEQSKCFFRIAKDLLT